jgi:RNA polymerase sigma-70 factor, ECF subfamily
MSTLSERLIIESIKKGDRKSFEYLFKNYYSNLCKYAGKIVHNDVTSEDIVMDVFARLWEAGTNLIITTSISGYLYKSVHNQCINYLSRQHIRFSELDAVTNEKLNGLIPPDLICNQLDNLNVDELNIRIEQGIMQLPEECRKIFILSRGEDLSNKEIASRMGISENTVKVQIYRALIKLRSFLKDFLSLLFML